MKIVKKFHFTLLELLIVLFILSFGIILTGVKIQGVYKEQRFLSDAQQVLGHLAMAQDLMLIIDTDIEFHIAKNPEKKEFLMWLEIEKAIEEPWARLINRKIPLKAIQSYQFKGSFAKDLVLRFSLGKMSEGTLTLFKEENPSAREEKENKFEIELAGYPKPMGKKDPFDSEESRRNKDQLLHSLEVYEKLYVKKS